ncbi:MAG: hypothetical protein JWO63_1766 [Frankiales bacterium]|nr:hypothetical protein [Frankiales bacterium]
MVNKGPKTLLLDSLDGLQLVQPRWRDRLLVRLLVDRLDLELAAGRSPDDNRLRSLRAAAIVAPPARERLAGHWEATLERAANQANRRIPLPRDRIVGAKAEIRALAQALRAGRPVSARGVAMAYVILVAGAGPLHGPRGSADLRAAIEAAIAELVPVHQLA